MRYSCSCSGTPARTGASAAQAELRAAARALSLSFCLRLPLSFCLRLSLCLFFLSLSPSRAACLSLPPSLYLSLSRLPSVPRVYASLTSLIPSTSTDVFKVRGSVVLANMHVSHMWLHTRVSWTLRYDDRVEGRRLDRVSHNFSAERRNGADGYK